MQHNAAMRLCIEILWKAVLRCLQMDAEGRGRRERISLYVINGKHKALKGIASL
jgi:hypothetical protein